jgi:Protein of unknown function (DUF429)
VQSLSKHVALNEEKQHRMICSADALDAVICAFAAIAVTTGRVFEPPGRPPKEESGSLFVPSWNVVKNVTTL